MAGRYGYADWRRQIEERNSEHNAGPPCIGLKMATGTGKTVVLASNLFTAFGEPDIEVSTREDRQVVVDLKGVDVFGPTTGEVRSNDTGQIALWMIDTNYNEE